MRRPTACCASASMRSAAPPPSSAWGTRLQLSSDGTRVEMDLPRLVPRTGCSRPQVIIVIYLSVVGALLLYMAFLMLVDPLIRKPDAYTEQLHNEEENEDARSMAAAAASLGGPRANTVLERVEGAQQRWKLQVQEQRKTVFDRHKMLS
ncbi:proton-transporting V-type ATPase complex assembly regulator TMEM9 isoform 2-T2 [Trichechus inunguis]